jgi:TetR/AcrR family transcriptional regulator, tetracycline repressor protein
VGNSRADVVEQALAVLDGYGLADLTMRRLGTELGVQPSALYHHFANKQTLLAAVADEILARGVRRRRPEAWDHRVVAICAELRDAMLAYRDGAELVATARSFGLGASAPYDELVATLSDGGLDPVLVPTVARTVLHFVFGHVVDEQTHLQAGSAGAIDGAPREDSDFALGLAIVVDGIRLRVGEPVRNREARAGAGR